MYRYKYIKSLLKSRGYGHVILCWLFIDRYLNRQEPLLDNRVNIIIITIVFSDSRQCNSHLCKVC